MCCSRYPSTYSQQCYDRLFEERYVIMYSLLLIFRVGGADGRYRFTGVYDLRPYGEKDHSQFIMQGIHSTLVHHYNDTLNFLIISPNNKTTTVQVSRFNHIVSAPLCRSTVFRPVGHLTSYLVKYPPLGGVGLDIDRSHLFPTIKQRDLT